MNGTTFMIIIIAVIILGVTLYVNTQKNKQLQSEGKIIERSADFMEKAEYFTLSLKDPEQVTEGVRKISYSEMAVSMKGDSEKQSFHFSNTWGWNARLYYTGEEDGKAVYCFKFLNWKKKDGFMIEGGIYMNMLVTAIEKMFLDIDPDTQVTDKRLDIKTKHSFF